MDMPMHQDSLGDLIDQTLDHYRAGRWEAALANLTLLRERDALTPELLELDEDIRLKQVYEGLAVTAVAPRRSFKLPVVPLLTAGALGLVALVGGLIFSTLNAAPSNLPVSPQAAAVIGALPTPAPTSTPQPTPLPSEGRLLVAAAADAPLTRATDRIELIFDASGSMLARLDGDQRKIDIAHAAVAQMVEVLPADSEVALRTYGRNRPDDCSDLELVLAAGPLDRAALTAQVLAIEPVNLGRTPIAASLAQIAADPTIATNDTLVVLLSDGEESCDGDPVAVAGQLHSANPRLRISVIGFAVDAAQQEQLAAIARAGGGSFFAAADVAQLSGALREAVVPIYRVFDASGSEIAQVDLGESLTVAPGRYEIEIGIVDPLRLQVEVNGGEQTTVEVHSEDNTLRADVRNEE